MIFRESKISSMPTVCRDGHSIVPKYLGGTDEYKNLIIVSSDIHCLIHATKPETIQKYLEKLNLDAKQLRKLDSVYKRSS